MRPVGWAEDPPPPNPKRAKHHAKFAKENERANRYDRAAIQWEMSAKHCGDLPSARKAWLHAAHALEKHTALTPEEERLSHADLAACYWEAALISDKHSLPHSNYWLKAEEHMLRAKALAESLDLPDLAAGYEQLALTARTYHNKGIAA